MPLFQLEWPFRLILSGASSCGKSTLLGQIILNRKDIIDQHVDKIIYCAKYQTSIPQSIRDDVTIPLVFHEGVPTEELIRNENNENVLICLDDLLECAFKSGVVSSLFTQGRNRSLSVILLIQNLFPRYPNARNISLNANYLIIFRNLRDSSSLIHLAKQVCPSNSKAFSEMFINNVNTPYSYLFMDFTPTCSDLLRYRQDIFSESPTVFINETEIKRNGTETKSESNSTIQEIIDGFSQIQ